MRKNQVTLKKTRKILERTINFQKWKTQWMDEILNKIELKIDSVDWNIELKKWIHNVSHRDGKYKRSRVMEDKIG